MKIGFISRDGIDDMFFVLYRIVLFRFILYLAWIQLPMKKAMLFYFASRRGMMYDHHCLQF